MKNDAKSQLEDILQPDSLDNKLLQIRLFQVNGNSMLFSGGSSGISISMHRINN